MNSQMYLILFNFLNRTKTLKKLFKVEIDSNLLIKNILEIAKSSQIRAFQVLRKDFDRNEYSKVLIIMKK